MFDNANLCEMYSAGVLCGYCYSFTFVTPHIVSLYLAIHCMNLKMLGLWAVTPSNPDVLHNQMPPDDVVISRLSQFEC